MSNDVSFDTHSTFSDVLNYYKTYLLILEFLKYIPTYMYFMHNFLLKEITFYTKIKKCFAFPIHLFLMPQCVNMRFQDSYVNIVRHHNYIYIVERTTKSKRNINTIQA